MDCDVSFVLSGHVLWNKTFIFHNNLMKSYTLVFYLWPYPVDSVIFELFSRYKLESFAGGRQ